MDERRLRLYEFLLEMERITIDEVPDLYKTAIQEADDLPRKKSQYPLIPSLLKT